MTQQIAVHQKFVIPGERTARSAGSDDPGPIETLSVSSASLWVPARATPDVRPASLGRDDTYCI